MSTRSSFVDLLGSVAPDALPKPAASELPHGTTIVACIYDGGVAIAGDRRATASSQIVSRDIRKVFAIDETSVIGIAGTAGIALDLVRLFSVECEHYEKMEGAPLSFDGKANRLGSLIRGNIEGTLRGLGVVPLLVGFDGECGRMVSFDAVGGRYPEADFYALGSGSPFARGSLKKLWRPGLDALGAATVLIQALVDASDDDAATGGPDGRRGNFPTVFTVDAAGAHAWPDADVADLAGRIGSARDRRPNGPEAPLL